MSSFRRKQPGPSRPPLSSAHALQRMGFVPSWGGSPVSGKPASCTASYSPDGVVIPQQPELRSWTGEVLDGRFLRAHFVMEFFGSALLIFAGTMLQSQPNTYGVDSVAFIVSLVFGGMRYIRPSVTMDPLATLIPEIVILNYHWSAKGMFKIVLSIAAQLSGSIFGAYLSFFFQGSQSSIFSLNLAGPAPGAAISEYGMLLGDAVSTFMIGVVQYLYILQLIKEFKDSKTDEFEAEPVQDSGSVVLIPKIESASTGAILLLAIEMFYATTRGVFVITRSFGVAVILNNFSNIGWYFAGQFIGNLVACVFVYVAFFDHF